MTNPKVRTLKKNGKDESISEILNKIDQSKKSQQNNKNKSGKVSISVDLY